MRGRKNALLQKILRVPTLVSLTTILVSLVLVVLQFAGIIYLRTDELLCLILALLVMISGLLFGERIGILRKIQEKQEKLERLISRRK